VYYNNASKSSSNELIVICTYIKAAKSYFDEPREKLSPRSLAAEAHNLQIVKGFRSQGVHNILCATENL
jgi:leucyl aminopeptidase